MKKTALFLTLIIICLMLTGCYGDSYKGELILEYPEDTLPKLITASDTHWFYMLSEYGSSDYTLTVGSSYDSLKRVHSFTDARVWHMDAEGDCVVWSEDRDGQTVYNLYSEKSSQVKTIFTADKTADHQLANMGISDGIAYYAYTDYENEACGIYGYDIEAGESYTVYNIEYTPDPCIMALGFDDNYISVASGNKVFTVDVNSSDTVFSYTLGDDISYVYGLSYDAENDVMGIYYHDSEAEQIGIIDKGELISVFTLNENHYAYNENIVCRDGHLYWVTIANVSGNIRDHYTYIDYDYISHKPTEVNATFGFVFKDGETYLLRMGETQKEMKLYKDSKDS
ncbi:MAG: hypothetical protein IKT46_01055 [Clostridia bacterium]|nr:hypothetical protein [Clostridia bacterium]